MNLFTLLNYNNTSCTSNTTKTDLLLAASLFLVAFPILCIRSKLIVVLLKNRFTYFHYLTCFQITYYITYLQAFWPWATPATQGRHDVQDVLSLPVSKGSVLHEITRIESVDLLTLWIISLQHTACGNGQTTDRTIAWTMYLPWFTGFTESQNDVFFRKQSPVFIAFVHVCTFSQLF